MLTVYKASEFKRQLRKSGLKATPGRLAVLEIMEKSKSPLSAQDVISRVDKKFDQATIYRIFKDLGSAGIIKQIDLRHNHAHYEIANTDDHHHLTCVHCGKIEDIPGCSMDDMYKEILDTTKNFAEIKQHSLEFYGVCRTCANKSST